MNYFKRSFLKFFLSSLAVVATFTNTFYTHIFFLIINFIILQILSKIFIILFIFQIFIFMSRDFEISKMMLLFIFIWLIKAIDCSSFIFRIKLDIAYKLIYRIPLSFLRRLSIWKSNIILAGVRLNNFRILSLMMRNRSLFCSISTLTICFLPSRRDSLNKVR